MKEYLSTLARKTGRLWFLVMGLVALIMTWKSADKGDAANAALFGTCSILNYLFYAESRRYE